VKVSQIKIMGVYGFDVNDEVRLKFLPFSRYRYVCWLSGPKTDVLYVMEERDPSKRVIDEIHEDVRKIADSAVNIEDLFNELDLYLSGRAVLIYR